MNPPGEQLVRDYLNRLALAARGRLGHRDRQGLLERTRAHIEVECGGLRDASAEQVRRALAAMGEPIALVEQERARIAADKPSADAGLGGLFTGRKSSLVRQLWPAREAAATADAGRHANGRVAVGDAQAAFGLQVPGQRPAMDGTSAEPVAPAGGAEPDGSTGRRRMWPRSPLPRRPPAKRTGPGTKRPALQPGRSAKPGPGQGASSGSEADPARAGENGDRPDEPASGIELDFSPADHVEEFEPGMLARLAGLLGVLGRAVVAWLGRLGTELVAVMVRDRLEAIAVALLGLGGAIYPPIWLVGVVIAVWSRKWDHRDKWLGLALPVFVVLFAAMLVVVLGGQRQTIGQYTTEFWLAAGRLSRVVAVLSAGYLLSRAVKYQGTRVKRQPPWTPRGKAK
jgi:hypothetical protein